jgi:hypothetical protein
MTASVSAKTMDAEGSGTAFSDYCNKRSQSLVSYQAKIIQKGR